MNLQQLYYFRTLAQIQHFTRAAAKLMVTQPSLSHSINDLEEELGISLFERTNRQVSLTKYGELFLEYVDRALNTLDEGRDKLNDFISPESGTVSLFHVSSVGPFIPYLVAKYLEENQSSQIMFQLQTTTNILIQTALRTGEADLGLGMDYGDPDGLCLHRIGEHELVLLVPAGHPLAGQDSVDLRDAAGERFVTYKQKCSIRPLIDTVFQSVGLSPRIVTETIHDTMIYSAVAAGFGVALAPAPLADPIYNVKVLRIENEIPKHEVFLKWKDMKYIAPSVAKFRDFVVARDHLFEEFRAARAAPKR